MAIPSLDRDTGVPVDQAGKLAGLASAIPFTQTQTTAPSTTSTTTRGTDSASQAVASATSSINTTPGALAALEQLITQLSDRPAIDQASVEAKYPLAKRVFSPQSGWMWTTPGGLPLSEQAATAYNARQQAKISEEVRAAGTIPGGTESQKLQQSQRQEEIQRTRQAQSGYSKEAAVLDANALIQKSISDALEQALPQITAGLEGAGTSKSTIGASLTQKAATKGATEGAALGANLGVQYGNITTGLEQILELLTRSDPNSPEAMLLNAIVGSKGLVSSGFQNQMQTGTTTKTAQAEQAASPQTVTTTRTPTLPVSATAASRGSGVAAPTFLDQQLTEPYMAISPGSNSVLESAYTPLFDSSYDLYANEEY